MPYKDPVKAKEYAESYRQKHKAKQAAVHKKYRDENSEKLKKYHHHYYLSKRFDKYGLTQEQFTENLEAQNNSCAVCAKLFSDDVRIYVDHCHRTGKVRGLVCMNCNTGLGHFKDDPDLLRKAIEYLNDPPFSYSGRAVAPGR